MILRHKSIAIVLAPKVRFNGRASSAPPASPQSNFEQVLTVKHLHVIQTRTRAFCCAHDFRRNGSNYSASQFSECLSTPALERSVFLCTAALDYVHGEVNKLRMPAVTISSVKGVLEENVIKNVTFRAAPCLYSRNYSVWTAYRFRLVKARC